MPALVRIPASRTEELRDFLLTQPDENLFHLSVLDDRGVTSAPGEGPFCFVGLERDGRLRAVAFIGGIWFASPYAEKATDAADLGRALRDAAPIARGGATEALRLRRVVGERALTDAFWNAWSDGRAETVLSHPQQLMVARAPAPPSERLVLEGLRPAVPAEEAVVHEASAAMQLEELGVDPRLEEPATFRAQIAERLRSGRTWVCVERGEIVFKAEVAVRSRYGAQIGGVWVPPSHRGRGLASRGMADLTRRLLAQNRVVSLHVHEDNAPALAAYRGAGFGRVASFRLVRGTPLAEKPAASQGSG